MEVQDLVVGLRRLVNQWDPIGVADMAPDDEYDCLVAGLYGKLVDAADTAEISEFLRSELKGHFGMDPAHCDVEAMADRLVAWWQPAAGTEAGRP